MGVRHEQFPRRVDWFGAVHNGAGCIVVGRGQVRRRHNVELLIVPLFILLLVVLFPR